MQANYTLNLPHYSVGPDAYSLVGDVIRPYGRKVAVIGGETALSKARAPLLAALENAGAEVVDLTVYGRDATMTNVNLLKARPGVQAADLLFAVGGGRCCDTVKTLADIIGKPCITCPTVASNCAPVSAVTVLYKDDGSLDRYHFARSCPAHCFINTSVILDSPEDLFWAGIGDALSKQIEVLYTSRGRALTHTPLLGVQLARACQDPILTFGKAALEDFRAKKATHAFTETVLDIIVSTGIVSNLVTHTEYYYNSSLAHCFYNASMSLPSGHEHLHGEVVSFGNLVLLAYDGQEALLDQFLDFNVSLGLPVTLAEVGITKDAELETLLDTAETLKEWSLVPAVTDRARFREAVLHVDAAGRARLAA
ncbi:MAG: iron-containing alcohol dehydrogenase family protein [Sutterella sp.]|nr:iron-containing alcohol dehydrogenase family protein [Sutterella sp.]